MITVIRNIFPDYFGRYLVAYSPGKISVLQKFITSKILLHLWMLMKNHTCTHVLQYLHYLENTISRWKRQKYEYMIRGNFHRVNFKPMIQRQLLKYFLYSLLYVLAKYSLPILRSPDQMIFRVIYRMWRSFYKHRQDNIYLCLRQENFSSLIQRTGYSSFKF
jgi:hypothetical protein